MLIKKLFFIFAILIFLTGVVNSQIQTLGYFKLGQCVTLKQSCGNCTFVNITNVLYPDSSVAQGQVIMTKSGTDYSFQFCNTSIIGTYIVNGFGDDNGIQNVWNYDFKISPAGQELTISKSVTYILIFVFSFIIFIGLFVAGILLPSSNNRDEMTGYIISVSNVKYVKMVSLGLSYIVAVFISYFSYTISYAYLDFNFVTSIFQFLFYGLLISLLPLFILGTYFTISNLVRDSQVGDYLSRGLKVQ